MHSGALCTRLYLAAYRDGSCVAVVLPGVRRRGAIFHKSAGLAFVCLKIDAFFSILNAYVQKTF